MEEETIDLINQVDDLAGRIEDLKEAYQAAVLEIAELREKNQRLSELVDNWRGKYLELAPTRCFIIWDKQQPEGVSFASCEYAWTSLNESAKTFYLRPQGADEQRIHPTQKPVALYDWIYSKYAQPDFKILDTHLGSGSNRIAANKAGLDFTGFEIDEEYFDASNKRYKDFISQTRLF